MRIKLLLAAFFAVAASSVSGQPLLQDPDLITGRLDNGLTYYIYPGTKPAG